MSKPELKRVFPTLVQRKLRIFFPTLVQRELWWCSQCWCNFSAPTIIICTKAVPSPQFSNTKNGARLMHLNKGGKFAHLQGIFEEGKKRQKVDLSWHGWSGHQQSQVGSIAELGRSQLNVGRNLFLMYCPGSRLIYLCTHMFILYTVIYSSIYLLPFLLNLQLIYQ